MHTGTRKTTKEEPVMNHKIFTVYDQKAEAYLPPFFLPQVGQATRVFADCVNSDSHQFAKHPEDYTLFQLGTFDDNTGEILKLTVPKLLGTGLDFKVTHDPAGDQLDLVELYDTDNLEKPEQAARNLKENKYQ